MPRNLALLEDRVWMMSLLQIGVMRHRRWGHRLVSSELLVSSLFLLCLSIEIRICCSHMLFGSEIIGES